MARVPQFGQGRRRFFRRTWPFALAAVCWTGCQAIHDKTLSSHAEEKTPAIRQCNAIGPGALDLSTALSAASAANPTIAIGQEEVRARRTEVLAADVLMLPSLHAGADYHRHIGNTQTTTGRIADVSRESSYVGAGTDVVGGGRVRAPGIWMTADVADAWFEPIIARDQLSQSQWECHANRNAILLAVAIQHCELAGAYARVKLLRQSEDEVKQVADLTANFARAGQGRAADADRAASELELIRTEVARVNEDVAVASARLARLLSVNPSSHFELSDDHCAALQIVPTDAHLTELVYIAEQSHPAIRACNAAVEAAQERLREERVRPWVPVLAAGYSAGGFAGGNEEFGQFDGRADFDVQAVWSLNNLGFSNCATTKLRQSQLDQARAERTAEINRVRREVGEAFALVLASRQEIDVAKQRVTAAQEGAKLDLSRARNLEGRPIEVLNSVTTLATARQELVRAIVSHNQAQFRLVVAMGQSPAAPTIEISHEPEPLRK